MLAGNGDGVHTDGDPIAAPSIAGAASMPDYTPLRDQAIVPVNGGGKTYVGQADDPFFLDLRVFDLLYGGERERRSVRTRWPATTSTPIALQLPKSALALNGNATKNPVIGIWSTTDERKTGTAGELDPVELRPGVTSRQPARQRGRPAAGAEGRVQHDQPGRRTPPSRPAVDAVQNPRPAGADQQDLRRAGAAPTPRNDLTEIFLQGISKANAGLSGDPAVGAAGRPQLARPQRATSAPNAIVPSEMLRLNMSVPVTAKPEPLRRARR